MTYSSSAFTTIRLSHPESIWLEPEHREQAKQLSDRTQPEASQWQQYLNELAVLAFVEWLKERLPTATIARSPRTTESLSYLDVNGFTVGVMAVEQVLDETVRIPQVALEDATLAAHFYVLQEVSEEQESVTVRGFCRHDECVNYRDRHPHQTQGSDYLFPLEFLDIEPNHLLVYCQFLQPASIPLPVRITANDRVLSSLVPATTRLTQWLQGVVDETWQAIEQLMNPEVDLAFSTRSVEVGVKRGKLINLGVQLGPQAVALVVTVTSDVDGKLNVLVQLYPTGSERYLMANLKLSVRSQSGKILQEVSARSHDYSIQLKPFKGTVGTRFCIAIQWGDDRIEESFEL